MTSQHTVPIGLHIRASPQRHGKLLAVSLSPPVTYTFSRHIVTTGLLIETENCITKFTDYATALSIRFLSIISEGISVGATMKFLYRCKKNCHPCVIFFTFIVSSLDIMLMNKVYTGTLKILKAALY